MTAFAPGPVELRAWSERIAARTEGAGGAADDTAGRWETLLRLNRRGMPLLAAGDDDAGLVTGWRHAEWDTGMLGVRVARVAAPVAWGKHAGVDAAARVLGRAIMEAAAGEDVTLVVSRVGAEDAGVIAGFSAAGMGVVDLNLQYRRRTGDLTTRFGAPVHAAPTDTPELRALGSTFTHDHFHADAKVPRDRADALFGQWIENSLAGRAAAVLVARTDEGGLAGFITCVVSEAPGSAPVGRIELVATAPGARRRGTARGLVWDALAWFRSAGIDVVDVGTQFANVGAGRLYRACGFSVVSAATTHHGWPGEPSAAG
ncbi:MAG: GNAT family N-acetyltransferase [Acidimicrobiia bacterium]